MFFILILSQVHFSFPPLLLEWCTIILNSSLESTCGATDFLVVKRYGFCVFTFTWLFWCIQLHLLSLFLTHIHHRPGFSTPEPDSNWLGVHVAHFSCQSFPCRKHHLLGFSPMNKQAIQSSPLNILISLASFSIGSALDELMVYVFSFVCVCFWTVNLCWVSTDRLSVQFSRVFLWWFGIFKCLVPLWKRPLQSGKTVCPISCLGLLAVTVQDLSCT